MSSICRKPLYAENHIHENGYCRQATTEETKQIAQDWKRNTQRTRWLQVAVGVSLVVGTIFGLAYTYFCVSESRSCSLRVQLGSAFGVGGGVVGGKLAFDKISDHLSKARAGICSDMQKYDRDFKAFKWQRPTPPGI